MNRVRAGLLLCLFAGVSLAVPVRAADEEECYRCHGLEGFRLRLGEEVNRLEVKGNHFESSVHSLLNCRECHTDIGAIPHPDATLEVSCGQSCHQQDQSGDFYSHESLFWEYTTSVHGGPDEKISCTVCHPSDSLAGSNRRDLVNEVRQCAACHRDNPHVRTYFSGFHYLALSQNNRRAPSCPDCHTSHRILSPDDPESSVHSKSLAGTCGSSAMQSGRAGKCHGTLGSENVGRAGMTPLSLPSGVPDAASWAFSAGYWGLLLGLVLRAGIGAVRKR